MATVFLALTTLTMTRQPVPVADEEADSQDSNEEFIM
jgi:hypothetical protein